MTPLIIGTLLALVALAYVLYPLLDDKQVVMPGANVDRCPVCGADADGGAVYCWECGRRLVS